jgi:hypothetical protein
MTGEVIAISTGCDLAHPTPNEICVATLEEALAQARAGGIVGVALARLHNDGCGSFSLSGKVGGYSMLGAVCRLQDELNHVLSEEEQ